MFSLKSSLSICGDARKALEARKNIIPGQNQSHFVKNELNSMNDTPL